MKPARVLLAGIAKEQRQDVTDAIAQRAASSPSRCRGQVK